MKLDVIREHYFHEQNRRMALDSAVTFPATILALLVGLVTYYLQILPLGFGDWGIPFYVLLGLGIVLLMTAGVFVVLSFVRYRYSDLASMKDWIDHHAELKAYVAHEGDYEIDPDRDLEEALRYRYADATDRYSLNNIRRMSHLHWAKLCLAIAATLLLLNAYPYYVLRPQGADADTVYKVQLIDQSVDGGIPMPDKPTKPAPQPAPKPKPTPPPNRETRDGSPKPKST